jgi:cell division protein FtsB
MSFLRRLPYSTLALLALLLFVHAQLWIGGSGKPYTMKLQLELDKQQALNDQARLHNDQLGAEVRDLREGLEMVEERARAELGMVKPDEILVQVARPR